MASISQVTLDSSAKLKENSANEFRCFRGAVSILNGMRLVVLVGVLAVLGILSLQILYFRKSIFILMVPVSVILLSAIAIVRQMHHFVWPIIAISCFHIFISLYMAIIFLFYYIFKPLYIIMVLNWAFDTLYTQKTTSYYVQCAIIFSSIVVFGLFNLWQLTVALCFKNYLVDSSLSTGSKSPSISLVVNCDDPLPHCKPCFR